MLNASVKFCLYLCPTISKSSINQYFVLFFISNSKLVCYTRLNRAYHFID